MGTIVIFGATGDLAGRKLIPAIYNLWAAGFLPRKIAVVGVARKDKSDGEFRAEMCEALKKHSRTGHGDSDSCDPFVSNLYYHRFDFTSGDNLAGLRARLADIEQAAGLSGHRLFYLAVSPEFFVPIVSRLGQDGLIYPPGGARWARVVFEKPFGHDVDSARALNGAIAQDLSENQIYRIDHYLGKETVQNIFAFRFGNAIFEPLFNQHYVDHVQITMAETVGMEGRRGAFYDGIGAMRDVLQNHLFQILCLVAMEVPARFRAKEVHDEKMKVLCSVALPKDEPIEAWCVRGQYTSAPGVPGYLDEAGVRPDSHTETYVALRLFVDNWRWAGVPFLLRAGKALAKRVTEVAIQFKQPPTHYFRELSVAAPQANALVFRIQPDEGISLTFNAKPPGMDFHIQPVTMDFNYGQAFSGSLPEAYERLLLDALRGDSTLFMRGDEIECAWCLVTEVLRRWKEAPAPEPYRPGTWGPPSAARLFGPARGQWRDD
ncbi:MAG: glucose-6-phosphate dehydrogenase [Candidatus Hydrogenedentes bacterium]|nr:glucose-6-phosphate dehydrogenase [Candidatus Hydrogenedentota bacterium]